jgi:hypothetical protein
VVSGSASDSFAQEPWILRLRLELAAAVERRQKILGICFGCQLMAIVLGGRSGTGALCTASAPDLATIKILQLAIHAMLALFSMDLCMLPKLPCPTSRASHANTI